MSTWLSLSTFGSSIVIFCYYLLGGNIVTAVFLSALQMSDTKTAGPSVENDASKNTSDGFILHCV